MNSLGVNVSNGKQGTFISLSANGKSSINTDGHQIPTTVQSVQQQSTTTTDPNAFTASLMRGQMMQQTLGMAFQGLGAMSSMFAHAGEKKAARKKDQNTELANAKDLKEPKADARKIWEESSRPNGGCPNGQCQ